VLQPGLSGVRRASSLGLWTCTALVVGNMVGSGVFLLPASLAPYGALSLVGWLVSAGGAVCLALVFARLGSILPKIGGPYAYARAGFGEFSGFLVAWSYWVSIITTNAALAIAAVSYSTVFFPALSNSPILAAGAAITAIWLFTAVSLAGTREAGRVQLVTTVVKLLPLVAIAVFGFLMFEPAHFRTSPASSLQPLASLSATVTLTLWAFLGLESGTVPADDVHDAQRTIPRATIIGTLIAAAVYIASTTAVMGVVPPAQLASSPAPFADAANALWGPWGRGVMAAGAAISCLGALNGWVLLSGQLPRAAAQDGLLPSGLARLSSRGSPATGILLSSAIATLLVAMNYTRGLVAAFTFLILLSTLATLVPYVFSSAWAFVLARGERPIRLVVAGIALVYSIWAVAGAGRDALIWGVVFLAAGTAVYLLLRRK
jgi:APA family basic amino acid/polyamine antiporter